MPKSKQKLIKLQALIFGVIILFPLICFGTFYVFKNTVWKKDDKSSKYQVQQNPIKIQKNIFNIEYDSVNNWSLSVLSAVGSVEGKNRNLLFNYLRGSNVISFQINEIGKNDKAIQPGQIYNGPQETNYISVSEDKIKNVAIIYEDLNGQKIARVEDPQFTGSYILIDLNSKKEREKDLNSKTIQTEKFLYNTRLNFTPEINTTFKDRVVVTEIKYTSVSQDLTALDNQVKKIKINN